MNLQSINPATGAVVGEVPVTPVEDIAGVVAKARAAQPAWAALGPRGRADVLAQAAQHILDSAAAVGAQLSAEMGKPEREAVGEVKHCGASLAAELEEMVQAFADEVIEDTRTTSTMVYEALGVCAAITPWNFPYSMPHWMVIPALMAGNTVVLKPSEETPLTGQAYADALNQVLPQGVLQVVHGADAQGKALVDADVDLVAFTGSREVGKKILAAVAPTLKRVVLELGGKDPLVVLADADLDRAAKFAARNGFRNAGQVCVSTERVYVEDAVAEPFIERLVEHTRAMEIGPMVSQRQRDHVVAQLQSAIRSGARTLVGEDGSAPTSNFLKPTVLVDVDPESSIAREETFGPVVCVFRVPDADAAVQAANDTPFGLGATVFGADDSATQVARRLVAGMVGINRGVGGASGTPWVGVKQSGYGFHKGVAGHRQFAQTRVISRSRA